MITNVRFKMICCECQRERIPRGRLYFLGNVLKETDDSVERECINIPHSNDPNPDVQPGFVCTNQKVT